MYKDKSGKVVASLTEVKNKTGDIFALVDEFGEIYLSSYNKIRYVIKKTGISDFIDLQEKEVKQPASKAVKAKSSSKSEPEPVAESKSSMGPEIDFVVWDRNNKTEANHVAEITKPLIEN